MPVRFQHPGVQATALFVFACLLYANTLGHEFALDDAIVITDNSVVQRGIAGWADLFTHDTFYGFFGEEKREALVAGGRYRPLTPALFAVEGMVADGPFLFHLLNVLWYGGAAVVALLLFRELLRDADLPWYAAPLAALLFTAHPLHTEAVANIKGRDEILAMAGAAAAAYLVLRCARCGGGWWTAVLGGILLLLGCLAKENAITYAAVIPLMLYATGRANYRYALPVAGAAVLFLGLRFAVVGGFTAPALELMNNPFLRETASGMQPLTWWERLPTVAYTGLQYLRLLFVPVGLVHDYYPASIALKGWNDPWVWGSILLHGAGLWWAALHLRSRHNLPALGILMYLLALLPVSNLLFSVGTLMSERFLFLPSLGFALAATVTVVRWRYGGWALSGVVVVFALLTVVRNPVWHDNYTLFTEDLPRQPRSAKLLNAAGGARLDRYQSLPEAEQARRQDLLLTAENNLTDALAVHPRYGNAYLLRGNARVLLGNFDAAIADYGEAARYGMQTTATDRNLVIALQRAGRMAGEDRNDFTTALAYLKQAEQLDPDNYETLRLSGIAYAMSGQAARAVAYFERALAEQPDNEGAQRNLDMARQQLRAASGG